MIKMIILDLDKTLLNDNGVITDYSKSIINQCRNLGLRIIIATARSLTALRYAIGELIVDAMICNNGAQIIAQSYSINEFIEHKNVVLLINKLVNDKNVGIIKVTAKNGEYSNINNIEKHGVKYIYNDFVKQEVFNVYKIMIETSNNFSIKEYQQIYNCSIQRIRGGNKFLLTSNKINKLYAIENIVKHFNLSIHETLAFGDDINDMQMLQNCGVGVATSNSSETIMEIADFVCDSNQNDGVAKWIEENLIRHKLKHN